MDELKALAEAIVKNTKKNKTNAYEALATVLRIDGEKVYVHIDGGAPETPATATMACKEGDTVRIHVEGGKAWIIGNVSAPATDDTAAILAKISAKIAQKNAGAAQTKAEEAAVAAATAQSKADSAGAAAISATKAANSAGEAAATAQAAAEAAQGKIDDQQEFFWHDAMGAHILGSRSDTTRYRTDIGSDGLSIKDVSTAEIEVASFKATGAVIGKKDETHAEIDSDSFDIIDAAGDTKASLGGETPMIQIGKFVFINRDNGNLTIKIV